MRFAATKLTTGARNSLIYAGEFLHCVAGNLIVFSQNTAIYFICLMEGETSVEFIHSGQFPSISIYEERRFQWFFLIVRGRWAKYCPSVTCQIRTAGRETCL